MAKKRRGGRRRGFRGLRGLRGMGGKMGALVPVAAGSVLTGATTLGIRTFVQPTPGTAGETIYKWAPAIGIGAGLAGAGVLYALKAKQQALVAAAVSLLSGGVLLGSERLLASQPAGIVALTSSAGAPAGTQGLGALLPEYGTRGLGGIVMQPLNGTMGEDVALSGLQGGFNPAAFGQRGY